MPVVGKSLIWQVSVVQCEMSDELSRLRALNERLESENAAIKLELYFKDGRIDQFRSHLWDRGNELAEAQSQLSWYQDQMKRLEKQSRHNQRTIQGFFGILKLFLFQKYRYEKTTECAHVATLLGLDHQHQFRCHSTMRFEREPALSAVAAQMNSFCI